MKRPFAVGAAVLLLTVAGFVLFPGHSILQSDTQIYVPILQRLEDPSLLSNDIMAVRPHVSFTIYDEVTLLLRRVTGLSLENVLLAQQIVYRAAGILGLYLIASAAGLSVWPALVVTALVSLGATVYGPTVLTVEYEPVPRAFALPLVLLSLGAVGHARWRTAVLAGGIGWCFHPPTALVYCLLLAGLLLWLRRWTDLALLAAAPLVLLLTMAAEGAPPENTVLFTRIEPWLEKLQRMRAPYNWIGLWWELWWPHYSILTVVWAVATYRIRSHLDPPLRIFFVGLPVAGILSAPVSWLIVDHWKWSLGPLFQPARYFLFITLFAAIACAVAGAHAAMRRRYVEAAAFFFVPFAAPLVPDLAHPRPQALALAVALAILAAFLHYRPAAALAALLPFVLIPTVGGIKNIPDVHSTSLDQLAAWASRHTPEDAVFQFADARRGLEPGIFRARARRAIYADWKAGGQVNYQPGFARLWSERWAAVQRPLPLNGYRQLGIDYVVYRAPGAPKDIEPVYANEQWRVFQLSP